MGAERPEATGPSKRSFRAVETAPVPVYPTLEVFDAGGGRRAFLRRLVATLLGSAMLAMLPGEAAGGRRRPPDAPKKAPKKPTGGKKRKRKKRKPWRVPDNPGFPPSRRARLDELDEL